MVPIVAGFLLILSKFFFSFDSLTMASKPPTRKGSRARRETCDEVVDVFEAADLLVLLLLLLLVSLQLAPSSSFLAVANLFSKSTQFKTSSNTRVLSSLSEAESAVIEGLAFTSINHGFKCSSSITSYPYNSKHLSSRIMDDFTASHESLIIHSISLKHASSARASNVERMCLRSLCNGHFKSQTLAL